MGCCSSKFLASAPQNKQQRSLAGSSAQRPRSDALESRAPPPPAEEETVKEVLSETPKPKPTPNPTPKPVPITNPEEDQQHEDEDEEEQEKRIPKIPKPVFPIIKLDEDKKKTEKNADAAEEISEASEICSLSESISTTTITRDDDYYEEVGQRAYRSPMKFPKNRSLSGDLGPKRERATVGQSPSRRSNQSPGRRNGAGVGSVRLVQGREPRQPMARRGVRTEQHRRTDAGESSARRSRSPATSRTDGGATRSGVGRSPSSRRSVRSPGRAAAAPVDGITRRAAEDPRVEEDKWPAKTTTDETLDNPLVSLECFIFL